MDERTRSRLLLAATSIVAGVLGEILSPNMFGYGVGLIGVLVFQIVFIGVTLLGIYVALGGVRPERGTAESSFDLTPGMKRSEIHISGTDMSRLQKEREWIERRELAVILITLFLIALLWVAAELGSYVLLSESPYLNVNHTPKLLLDTSLITGFALALVTLGLRAEEGRYHRMMLWASSIALILIALAWMFVEQIPYAMLSEYLEAPDYIALARLSSEGLLAGVFMTSLIFRLPGYLRRFKSPRTM